MRLTKFTAALPLLLAAHLADAQQINPFKYVVDDVVVTDLGSLGSQSGARDINDLGDVVGWTEKSGDSRLHAFIHLNGQMYSIHSDPSNFRNGFAQAINNSRVVVGYYQDANYPVVHDKRAFYYYPGIWLSWMPSDASSGLGYEWTAEAYGITETDRIVGTASMTVNIPPPTLGLCHQTLAVVWNNAGQNPYGLFCIPDPDNDDTWWGQGIKPVAHDINNSNNIVGTDGGKTTYSMFFYNNLQNSVVTVPKPAGAPLFDGSTKLFGVARGMNDSNWVVGSYGHDHEGQSTSQTRAFVWNGTSASAQSLGTFTGGTRSAAHEINEQYMVVGDSGRTWNFSGQTVNRTLAFLWHSNFGLFQLPGIGGYWHASGGLFGTWIPNSCTAWSVNDRKASGLVQAVGECTVDSSGTRRAVRWDITVRKVSIPSGL
ncbi:MAG TPA: DUF3466 family protein [Steroidobacteraceae bacterium]|nr:DUF3466 family protein [Steroidobacteraceae bacterium]